MSFQSDPAERPIRAWLEVDLDAQPIEGTLSAPDGPARPFVGWLGLTAALAGLSGARDLPAKEKSE